MSLFGNKKKDKPKPQTTPEPISEIGKLERWYASVAQQKGWDCSAIGFHNWLKQNRSHLL